MRRKTKNTHNHKFDSGRFHLGRDAKSWAIIKRLTKRTIPSLWQTWQFENLYWWRLNWRTDRKTKTDHAKSCRKETNTGGKKFRVIHKENVMTNMPCQLQGRNIRTRKPTLVGLTETTKKDQIFIFLWHCDGAFAGPVNGCRRAPPRGKFANKLKLPLAGFELANHYAMLA